MAESTLALQWSDIRAQVGDYLGFGVDPATYSAAKLTKLQWVLDSGVRQFYNPPPLPGEGLAHEWSFLRPTAQMATVASTADYELPGEFADLDGAISYVSTTTAYPRIDITGEERIRVLRANQPTYTGRPTMAATRWEPPDQQKGQRALLLLYPTPDAAYTLQYRFKVNPLALRAEAPWPYGGAAHAETILASCLAVAEERYDDGGLGQHRAKFMERLAASISMDAAMTRGEAVGYNGDNSDRKYGAGGGMGRCVSGGVTYNGVQY